ncbi:MAG TPA: hypothetical protein VKZ74_00925 [Natronosporangium sp.]|nr:hypothetical protein [Natronosporangium sp.]
MRKKTINHGELLRSELSQTMDHAMRAAGHAAGGINEAMRPRMEAVRMAMAPKVRDAANRGWTSTVTVLAPITEAAQARMMVNGKKEKKEQRRAKGRRRWPAIAGLLVSGVAMGGVAAMLLRQRREQEEAELVEPGTAAPPSGQTSEGAATSTGQL